MTTTTQPPSVAALILGREPVAIIGAVQAALVLAVSFGWLSALHITGQDDVAIVVGVLSAIAAVYNAWKTDETVLAPVIQLFQAGLSLAAIYGLHLSDAQTGYVVAFITTVAALFHRTQVTPLARGTFHIPLPKAIAVHIEHVEPVVVQPDPVTPVPAPVAPEPVSVAPEPVPVPAPTPVPVAAAKKAPARKRAPAKKAVAKKTAAPTPPRDSTTAE